VKGKVLFVAGLAVGYVLGTRAGRERYEQIKSAAARVWNTPTVQHGVDQAKDFALSRVGDVSDTVLDGAKKLIKAATQSSSSTTKPATRTNATKTSASQSNAEESDSAGTTGSTKPAAKSAPAKSTAAKTTASKTGAAKSSASGTTRTTKKPAAGKATPSSGS
jgi:hypothetical protein